LHGERESKYSSAQPCAHCSLDPTTAIREPQQLALNRKSLHQTFSFANYFASQNIRGVTFESEKSMQSDSDKSKFAAAS
jgi:hypothetical protein